MVHNCEIAAESTVASRDRCACSGNPGPGGWGALLRYDSTYVRDGITKWLPRWKHNGWLTVGKQPVKNAELWQRLDAATSRHQVRWHWVKGHAGHPDNERADRLAGKGLRKARPAPVAKLPALGQRAEGHCDHPSSGLTERAGP